MASGMLFDSPPETDVSTVIKGKTETDKYGSYYPVDPAKLKLESNFGPMHPDQMGYLQPTSKDTPIKVMRERYYKDGYLHVRLFGQI